MNPTFPKRGNSPRSAVIKIAIAILGGEFLIMVAIEMVFTPLFGESVPSSFWEFIDPVLLALIVVPVLHFAVLRPMREQQLRLEQQKNEISDFAETIRMQKEHQDAIFTAALDAIVLMNSDGLIIGWSGQAENIFGWSRDEALDRVLHELIIPPRYREQHINGLKHFLATGKGRLLNRQTEINAVHRDGHEFPIDLSIVMLKIAGDYEFSAFIRDISVRKKSEESLRITASVFDNSQEAIVITDANNTITDVNAAFTRITGYSREEVIGKNPKLLNSGRQDADFYNQMWSALKQDKNWRGEIWNRRKSGETYAEQLSITAICDDEGKIIRYVAIFSDITHIKAHEAELHRAAHYDALTGIPNRSLLADRMNQAISQTAREGNSLAVCYLDLDGFKPINDTLGHEAGDQILIEVAKRIGKTIRGNDTVARLGGDEFVVLLLGLDEGDECVTTLNRLLSTLSRPVSINGQPVAIGASIGVSIYPHENVDQDALLRHADQAMYIAKQSGKNRYHIFEPMLDISARKQ